MGRRRHAARLGIPGLIVAALAAVAFWRVGPVSEPDALGTSGVINGLDAPSAMLESIDVRELGTYLAVTAVR